MPSSNISKSCQEDACHAKFYITDADGGWQLPASSLLSVLTAHTRDIYTYIPCNVAVAGYMIHDAITHAKLGVATGEQGFRRLPAVRYNLATPT